MSQHDNLLYAPRHQRRPTLSRSLQQQSCEERQFRKPEQPSSCSTNHRQTMKLRANRCSRQPAFIRCSTLGLLLLALAASVLLAATASADHAQPQQQQQDGYAGSQQQQVSGPDYDQPSPAKTKKIQIVYIKVPLAKLKPSLANEYATANQDNATSYAGQHDTTETKSQGSQSSASAAAANDPQQQQQVATDEQRMNQQQLSGQRSFLIPMAVIQAPSEGEGEHADQSASGVKLASSNYLASHAQPPLSMLQQMQQNAASSNFRNSDEQVSPSGRHSRQHQSPMHAYQQLLATGSVSHGINHGFMSSFLQAEKEKMAAVGGGQVASPSQQLDSGAASAASATSSSPNASQQQQQSNSAGNHQQQTNNPAGNYQRDQQSRGLAPVNMMQYSMMPDSMIGQAYNAAVGQALPVESGSPASLLSSPSTAHADNNSNGKRGTDNSLYLTPGGGSAGTHGEAATSHGTASSGSYGAAGQGPQGSGSSASAYQHSASGFGDSALSSGYGNGINSFGASVAFSDYPISPSIGSGQQTYGPQLQPSSSNSHHLSPSSEHSGDSYGGQKLRQAKKTIIPIVVQVEHAIMEATAAQMANSNNNYQANKSNKYGARGHRQLNGNGKRSRGYKSLGEQVQGYRNNQNNNNVPYGAATNEMSFGAGGAQYVNAANAQDINQITAQINAENAASAAAALAQADMALGGGSPAYIPNQGRPANQRPQGPQGVRPSPYAAGLQSAASALLANTHPAIQAAASGGLAQVSKLGAKLGEIIALPSMTSNSISSIGASLPSALSSISNQMGMQIGQAVQQVAKEHPTAHAFARQVAQHAGLNLAQFNGALLQQQQEQHNKNNNFNLHQQQLHQPQNHQQQQAAASNQHSQSILPHAQLQNLKLSIGQNLQTAAAQLIGANQKTNAQSVASLLSSPLAALYPPSVNAALKQLSASSAIAQPSVGYPPSSMQLQDPQHAQSSSIVAVHQPQQTGDVASAQSALVGDLLAAGKPGKSSTLKSKFLSFFAPPKFISNLLSWNDRADERSDKGEPVALATGKAPEAKRADEAKPANATKGDQAKEASESMKLTTLPVLNITSTSAAPPQQRPVVKAAEVAQAANATSTTPKKE